MLRLGRLLVLALLLALWWAGVAHAQSVVPVIPQNSLPAVPVQQAPPVQNNAPLSETVPPGAPADPREYLREQIMAPTTNDVPPAVDPWQELSAQGEGAFNRGCIGCHDADRSLLKSKSFSQWQAAIKRMAQKDGAELNPAEFDAIAAYLTRQTGGEFDVPPDQLGRGKPGFKFFGTFSPTWRGGNSSLENNGFFPDIWLGVNLETGTALSGRVTACVSCHDDSVVNDRIALVEGVARLDLATALNCPWPGVKSAVEAGRFVVPFGAFAAQSNPGVYRTVSRPLIYNMGQGVYDGALGQSVLPMPFSDEGANISFGANVFGDVYLNWNNYVIHGLQATRGGINFDLSRGYLGFNSTPTVGTRLTLGNEWLTFGGSFMTGRSSLDGGVIPDQTQLYYKIYGFDATVRASEYVRLQFEYARRDSDRVVDIPLPLRVTDAVHGYYGEAEFLLYKNVRAVHFLTRYDLQQQVSATRPVNSSVGLNNFFVSRFTYGLNFTFANSSTLMLNHEYWMLPSNLGRVNVFGVRWSYSF